MEGHSTGRDGDECGLETDCGDDEHVRNDADDVRYDDVDGTGVEGPATDVVMCRRFFSRKALR